MHAARPDLPLERLIRAQQELLARLTARIKRARHLRASERAIGQVSAVLAPERDALSHALVNDVDADFCEAVDVGFARAKVAPLDRVVEQAINAVAVVAVILRGVYAALRGYRMRAARAVLIAETLDVVAKL